MPIPIETMGLREAAERFGVSVDTLRRRIKDDEMREAFKAEGKFGTTWVVPIAAMADIAERERWALKLDVDAESQFEVQDDSSGASEGSAPSTSPVSNVGADSSRKQPSGQQATSQQVTGEQAVTAQTLTRAAYTVLPTPVTPMPDGMTPAATGVTEISVRPLVAEENLEWVERLLAAETRATGAETRLESMEADAQAAERRISQLTRDLEHERAELRRLRTDLASEEKAKEVALARTDELRGQLKSDRLDLEARIGVAKAEAQSHSERAEELQARLGSAESSMGWWSKRRFEKISQRDATRSS